MLEYKIRADNAKFGLGSFYESHFVGGVINSEKAWKSSEHCWAAFLRRRTVFAFCSYRF